MCLCYIVLCCACAATLVYRYRLVLLLLLLLLLLIRTYRRVHHIYNSTYSMKMCQKFGLSYRCVTIHITARFPNVIIIIIIIISIQFGVQVIASRYDPCVCARKDVLFFFIIFCLLRSYNVVYQPFDRALSTILVYSIHLNILYYKPLLCKRRETTQFGRKHILVYMGGLIERRQHIFANNYLLLCDVY